MNNYERLKYLRKLRDKETRVKYKESLQYVIDLIKKQNPCDACRHYKKGIDEMPCCRCVFNGQEEDNEEGKTWTIG